MKDWDELFLTDAFIECSIECELWACKKKRMSQKKTVLKLTNWVKDYREKIILATNKKNNQNKKNKIHE